MNPLRHLDCEVLLQIMQIRHIPVSHLDNIWAALNSDRWPSSISFSICGSQIQIKFDMYESESGLGKTIRVICHPYEFRVHRYVIVMISDGTVRWTFDRRGILGTDCVYSIFFCTKCKQVCQNQKQRRLKRLLLKRILPAPQLFDLVWQYVT